MDNKLKLKFVFVLALFLLGFYAQSVAAQIQTQTPINGNTEEFVDLLGTVNYTYYSGGIPSSVNLNSLNSLNLNSYIVQGTSHFALEIGAWHVFYYTMKDGSIPTTIEQLYSPNVQIHVLYSNDPRYSNDLKVNPSFKIGGLQLQSSPYTGGQNNLTVNTLDSSQTAKQWSLAQLLANTTGAQIDATVVSAAPDVQYAKYKSNILGWTKTDELVAVPGNDPSITDPQFQTYGTDNMTKTVYDWLSRYIETQLGYNPFTVKVNDNTENVTSQGITTMMDSKFQNTIRKIVDHNLGLAGVSGFSAFSLSDIGKGILAGAAKVGSFAFDAGISAAKFTANTILPTAANIGMSGLKSVISAGITAGNAIYQGGKYVAKGTEKVVGFVANNVGKVVSKPFGFIGSIFKGVANAVSFVFKYWWLFLILAGTAFILFATPVGPFLANNTIKKVVK